MYLGNYFIPQVDIVSFLMQQVLGGINVKQLTKTNRFFFTLCP